MSGRATRLSRATLSFRPSTLSLEARQLLNADVLTYHNDNARTGQDLSETILTPANVNASTFGKVGSFPTDGKVDAQPLFVSGVTIPGRGVHDVLYVATEDDSVYAFDADNGDLLWSDVASGTNSLISSGETAVPAADQTTNVSQYPSSLGILSTPVIDLATNRIYVEVESVSQVGGKPVFHQRLHALDITTGLDVVTPATIDSSIRYPGTGPGGDGSTIGFDPSEYKSRDALTLSNGVVYVGWASNYGNLPYTGWVMGFRASDLGLQSVLNVNPAGQPVSKASLNSGDSFWNGGDGFAVDAAGNLYNITGNGPFDAALGDYGDSMLKLSTANNCLKVVGSFTPADQQLLADTDRDFGSGGILLLPPTRDASGNTVQLAVGAGKEGSIFLNNVANLGGYTPDNGGAVQVLSNVLGGPMTGAPTYFGNQVYFSGINQPLQAFTLANGLLSTQATSKTANVFYYPGAASPSISANGSGDGILWAVQKGSQAVLYAYDALNLSHELYDSNQAADFRDTFGPDSEFITPTIANGKVYVGTPTGIQVFGLLHTLPAAPPALTTPPVLPPAVPSPPTVAVPAFASPHAYVGGVTLLDAVGADAATGDASLKYTWTTTSSPLGSVAPTFSANGTNASRLVSVRIATPGAYTFEVSIADPSGQVATSSVAVNASYSSPTVAIPVFETTPAQAGRPNLFAAAGADPVFAASALTYTWTTTALPAGASPPTFSSNGGHASNLVAATFSKPGNYALRVTIANPAGALAASDSSFTVSTAGKSRQSPSPRKSPAIKSAKGR